jgi:hypothetical protein
VYGGSVITEEIDLNDGDEFGIRAIDGNITSFYMPSGGAWQNIISITDTTYTGAGYAGFRMTNGPTSGYINEFSGGDVLCQPMITPDTYTHTLSSGHTISLPLIISSGQLYVGFIIISLCLIGVSLFLVRLR